MLHSSYSLDKWAQHATPLRNLRVNDVAGELEHTRRRREVLHGDVALGVEARRGWVKRNIAYSPRVLGSTDLRI
jgi:hypothetical protein